MTEIHIRPAGLEDCDVIAEFNCRLAEETENKQLDSVTIRAGVEALLRDVNKGRYWLACHGERIVGQVMHTWEWSDWRNGAIWWLQSVYVHPDFRRQGVFRRLYRHVLDQAVADPAAVGLRLYVEQDNLRAQHTYRKLGMQQPGYYVMEQLVTDSTS